MSQRAVEYCLGRLMTDNHFRALAETSLPQACRRLGLELTSSEMDLLNQLDLSFLAKLASCIDPGLHRTGASLEQ